MSLLRKKFRLLEKPNATFQSTSHTISYDVNQQIKSKYKTFSKMNIHQLHKKRHMKDEQDVPKKNNELNLQKIMKTLITMTTAKNKKKTKHVTDQLEGVKAQRRERFKKSNNPLQFISYFIQQRNQSNLTAEQTYLIEKVINLKSQVQRQNLDLDAILRKIYEIMNITVDFNELRFLLLLTILAADISFQAKDYNRAMYFYNQSRVAATYSRRLGIKIEALMGMAMVSIELKMYEQSILLLKKCIQYGWYMKDVEVELLGYDLIGLCYYYQGSITQAQYYHLRFIQGQSERNDSALRKISLQIMHDYHKRLQSLEQNNLSSLFIEYLDLPITNFQNVPPSPLTNPNSPRKNKLHKNFDSCDFIKAEILLSNLMSQDAEFSSFIPDPDVQANFISTQKYGHKKPSGEFEKSSQYYRIIGKTQPINFKDHNKPRLADKINQVLSEKNNPNWWEDLLHKVKKNRSEKLGKLKDRITNSHYSYGKYPQERRKCISVKNEKIKQSFNKTLLDWIDPPK